jgi:hypothetical protein
MMINICLDVHTPSGDGGDGHQNVKKHFQSYNANVFFFFFFFFFFLKKKKM